MLATSCLDSYYHEERQGVIIDTEFFQKNITVNGILKLTPFTLQMAK